MLKKILIGLVVLLGALVAVVATRPADFKLERTAKIGAPADVVHAQLNDFHNWKAWSPWENRDPAQVTKFEGAESGVGASYFWSGNDDVGEGRMTITDSKPGELVTIKLEFLKPFAQTNTTIFTLKGGADGTDVSWVMTGQNNFMGKAFSMLMDMDKMVGPDFEQGLAKLKEVSEAAHKKQLEAAAAAAAAAAAEAAAKAPIEVSVDKAGKLTVDGAAMTDAQLTEKLKNAVATNPNQNVVLVVQAGANKAVPKVVDLIKAAGVTQVALNPEGGAQKTL